MSTEQTNGVVKAVQVDENGLTRVQRRFIWKCRRRPKPLSALLHECQIGPETFARWRTEEKFARAFRRASAGMTQDTLMELRFAFAMCGRIISTEVMAIHQGKGRRKKVGEKSAGGRNDASERQGSSNEEGRQEGRLEQWVYRFCFE